ncbi:MAG: lipopolysaccharide assembly protein LapA domain-containing protein [Nitrospirae bacterium YQR-1]
MRDFILLKFLPASIAIFLTVVFLDQNQMQVPVKVFFGSHVHVNLSLIIVFSVALGVVMTIVTYLIIKKMQEKLKRRKETEI